MVNARFEVRPGSLVVGPGDEVGRVEPVLVSPGTGEASGLVVRKGLLLRRDIVIPVEAVEATEEHVRECLTSSELNGLPEYHEKNFTGPPADWWSRAGHGLAGLLFRLPRPRLVAGGSGPGSRSPAAMARSVRSKSCCSTRPPAVSHNWSFATAACSAETWSCRSSAFARPAAAGSLSTSAESRSSNYRSIDRMMRSPPTYSTSGGIAPNSTTTTCATSTSGPLTGSSSCRG